MTHQGLAAKAVGAIMAAALIGGCTAAPTNTPTPTGPSQSSSPSQSPTVTPTLTLSPEDQKLEDAKARVVLLWQTLDGLLLDSSKSINELDTLASGEALSSLQVMLTTVRQRGQVQVGATKIPSRVPWPRTTGGLSPRASIAATPSSRTRPVSRSLRRLSRGSRTRAPCSWSAPTC